ncbi:MAG: hypothetical protein WDW38_010264 [Sanguina aurantia]
MAADGDNHEDAAVQPQVRKPLKLQVVDCETLWHQEAREGAAEGDVSQMVLLGQMLISGYGCPANPSEGKTWLAAAAAVNGQTVEALLPPAGQQLGHTAGAGSALSSDCRGSSRTGSLAAGSHTPDMRGISRAYQ